MCSRNEARADGQKMEQTGRGTFTKLSIVFIGIMGSLGIKYIKQF